MVGHGRFGYGRFRNLDVLKALHACISVKLQRVNMVMWWRPRRTGSRMMNITLNSICQHGESNIGKIIGGCVAGLICCCCVLGYVYWKKQKKANHRWFKKSKARNTEADDMMPGQNAYEVSDACKGEEQGKLQEANQRDEQWQM